MRWLVDICNLLVLLAVTPVLLYRALTTGKYRRDWDQRRGHMPVLSPPTPDSPRVWVHAVSVGEVNAARGLIAAWRKASPATQFIISATTDTGIDRARQLFPDLTVIRYPLDFSRFVARALERIAPSLIVLVELEVWYQFVTLARGRGIPVAVVNGRLSAKSARLFGWVRPVARRMFASLSWVGAQDETYAQRFKQLGTPAERVTVTGSVKWDTAEIADTIPGSEPLAEAMGIDRSRPLWVCGSTGPREEAVILEAFGMLRGIAGEGPYTAPEPGGREAYEGVCPELQLAIVPRKPERFNEVAELIRNAGYDCVRRMRSPDGTSCRARRASEGKVEKSTSRQVEMGTTVASAEDRARSASKGGLDLKSGDFKSQIPARSASEGACQRVTGSKPNGPGDGEDCAQRGACPVLPIPAGEGKPVVQLVDTMGELRKLYSLADVVFVGRSLANMGGSDTMEVAALGKPIVVGPHNENFADVVGRLTSAGALTVVNADVEAPDAADALAEAVGRLLADPTAARSMGERGRETVRQNRGATQRTMEHLMQLLPAAMPA